MKPKIKEKMEKMLLLGALICLFPATQVISGDDNNPLINHYADYETIHQANITAQTSNSKTEPM